MSAKRFKGIIPPRRLNSHKGDYGHVLILAGSIGLTGAAYLASRACILSGSGLVTLGIPEGLNSLMEVKLTEVMTKPLVQTKQISLSLQALPQIKKILPEIDALAIGPGLSQNYQTRKLIQKLLPIVKQPLVVDADGINALNGHLKLLGNLKTKVVLTPHPGELSRLLNLSIEEIQKARGKIAKNFARKYNLVLVLKGHRSVVASWAGQVYVNQTGNPGMASAGCGDVLTGIIAAFLGQGIEPFLAAKLGVYLHGLAGDYAAREKGQISLIASDILDKLPQALKSVS